MSDDLLLVIDTEQLAAAVEGNAQRLAERVVAVREAHGDFLLPTIYTPSLSDTFVSDGPRLRKVIKVAWRTFESPEGIDLDLWQAWLIDRVLERYPEDHPDPAKRGRLRYRQVVISIPRQNGKSVIAAILALYGLLMHEPGPAVVSVASTAEQARIVYNRVLYVIQSNADLTRRFKKMTETRGITTKDGSGTYVAKASKGEALQGIPVSLAVPDELHITKPAIWQSLVNGILTRADGLIVGVTTAGDDDSELLKSLYDLGKRAAQGDPNLERFGFFCWQAPEPVVPEDDADLAEWILVSNPSVYEARRGDGILANVIADVRAMPEQDAIRYRGNLFVASESAFIPVELWARNYRRDAEGAPEPFPEDVRTVFTLDRTPDWGYATINVTAIVGDVTHTEVVASIVRPTLEQLADLCETLYEHDPIVFGVDGYQLRDLGDELKRRGLPVYIASQSDLITASSLTYAKLVRGHLRHSGDELLARQIPRTVRKNVGDGYRISRKDSSVEIDGVIAMALGVLLAETHRDSGGFVF